MTSTLEVLHVPDCPNLPPLLERLQQITDLPVAAREIRTTAEAEAAGMAGSPTLLVDGRDPFSPADDAAYECGVACRIYRDERGRPVPAPSIAQLRAVLAASDGSTHDGGLASAGGSPAESPAAPDSAMCEPGQPGAVLSAWRSRALPLDPIEKAAHQAVLRSFATTGHAPTASQLTPMIADTERAADDVLRALHELDAIRLASDGRIAVAYPFSAQPTPHRVRIDDRVDVYAMCAIDALGMSAMLGVDTRIDSIDLTSGQPVTVAMTAAGRASWDPATAVVFLGADAGGGPSADCCCDYLNFFADQAAATAWTIAHPHVPGQILSQAEAERLGAQLFGPLLATP
ncbi:alkylmercury lyase [Pseudonocardia sp. CNS-004]|nr:alkylmercury lyase [Pseudonocardia sp. CNS-004]